MPSRPSINFQNIQPIGGSQQAAFEEFCCQLARRVEDRPEGGTFVRLRGAGGDGGVECLWTLENGEKWGWQAKFLKELDKEQIGESISTALQIHPELTRYTVCVPFELTGPNQRTRKRNQKSQLEKWNEYKAEWEQEAAALGMTVDFRIHGTTELLDDCLRIDPTHGRLRFWFDATLFGADWFEQHLDTAIKSAGRRFNTRIDLITPAAEHLDAFGRTPPWAEGIHRLADRLAKAATGLQRSVEYPDWNGENDFPQDAIPSAKAVLTACSGIESGLRSFIDRPGEEARCQLTAYGKTAALQVAECVRITEADLVAKHGENAVHSVGFRHFQAEIGVSFPARHYDASVALRDLIEEVREWLRGPGANLPDKSSVLMVGPAWVGKTHTFCAAGLKRHMQGLRSLVLLAQQFRSEEPWERIRQILGLPGDLARDALLSALDAAGEASDHPCVIFLDALNETDDRKLWQDHLAAMLEAVSRYEWVKLCVSCRTTYLEQVLPDGLHLDRIEHTGFAGIDFRAFGEFFRAYGLEPPSMPLMQPEFTSPGFLRLICEALEEQGLQHLPEGMAGLSVLVEHLLVEKNKKLAAILDYYRPEDRVRRALFRLVDEMSSQRTRLLPLGDAKRVVDEIGPAEPYTRSLFGHLIWEGLIAEDQSTEDGRMIDVIRFGFERLGDWVMAQRLLDGQARETLPAAFQPGGSLAFCLASGDAARENAGLLEAWAILLPEKFGAELADFAPEGEGITQVLRAHINSLVWRQGSHVNEDTAAAVQRALHHGGLLVEVLEALLSVAVRPNHGLNARWLHDFLRDHPMPQRDGFWAPFLHMTYGEKAGVDRAIRWAMEGDLSQLSGEASELWATLLLWFCTASDRRVRDHATKAVIRLMQHHPDRWPALIERFKLVDDEYVVERCLAACYGSLVLSRDDEALRATSKTVATSFFPSRMPCPWSNAMIRDYARLIIEHAADRGILPEGVSLEQCRPPYGSVWPPTWPDENLEAMLKASGAELPRLIASCLHDDFAIYTTTSALDGYEGLDINAAKRWILKNVLDLGYNSRNAEFDLYMLGQYGPGRARPAWAERIGKKYQWISLYRLLGQAADNLPKKSDSLDPPAPTEPALQAAAERNLDPTVLTLDAPIRDVSTWWSPTDYDFSTHSDVKSWMDAHDFPNSATMLLVTDPQTGRRYVVLEGNRDWSDRDESDDRYPQRRIWMHIHGYLVRRQDAAKCWDWLGEQRFYGRWMPEGWTIHGVFGGEYPQGLPARQFFEEANAWREATERLPVAMRPAYNNMSISPDLDAITNRLPQIPVPVPELLENTLGWNGQDGFGRSPGEAPVFLCPFIRQPGPQALLVDLEYLQFFLEKHDLALVWTILGEKNLITGGSNTAGYLVHSRAHRLVRGKPIIQSSTGIYDRTEPEEEE